MFVLRSSLTLISRIPQQVLFPQVRSDGRLVPAAGGVAGASRLQGPRHPCLPVQPGAVGRHHGGKDDNVDGDHVDHGVRDDDDV